MNQTMEEMAREYVSRLRKKMKLFREYPELFEDEGFAQRYIQEGDRFAALALMWEKLAARTPRRHWRKRPAAG